MESGPRTMLQVSAVLGVLVIGVAGWVLNERRTRAREEADLIKEIEANSQRPDAVLVAQVDWSMARDLELDSRAKSLGLSLQNRVLPCVDRWPSPPVDALIYVEADGAGRLTQLAVRSAPDGVQECLVKALKEGRFPRNAQGVTELPLSFR
ncbi:MAG: hypothetical protein ACI9VR_002478 [Cognaticolwellia sp.]|jgi:hypothetical protein